MIKIVRQNNVPELLSFCDTIKRHLIGIVHHTKFPIFSNKVEGVNNLPNTIRRKAYGYRDIEYFILKIKLAFMSDSHRFQSYIFL